MARWSFPIKNHSPTEQLDHSNTQHFWYLSLNVVWNSDPRLQSGIYMVSFSNHWLLLMGLTFSFEVQYEMKKSSLRFIIQNTVGGPIPNILRSKAIWLVNGSVFKWLALFGCHLAFSCTGSVFKWLVLVYSSAIVQTIPIPIFKTLGSEFKCLVLEPRLYHGHDLLLANFIF